MPPSTKSKASEIAAKTKKTFIPYITSNYSSVWPPVSYLCYTDSMIAPPPIVPSKCRFAFYVRDPVNAAVEWAESNDHDSIPVIMPANETRPGGDWESSVMMPEECLCRRSNLYATLTTPARDSVQRCNYPIPTRAGIYSARVVVFRDGPDKYTSWKEYRALPIISVCPVKRPRLDPSGKRYAFKQEKEQMRDKIHTALRIAIWYKHKSLCIGNFGLGNGFHNPTEEVALMWRDAFLKNPEFIGHFHDVVFAFAAPDAPTGTTSLTSRSSSSRESYSVPSSSSSSSHSAAVAADLETFRHIFNPTVIHNTHNQSASSKNI